MLNGIIGSLRESNNENGSQVSYCYAARESRSKYGGGTRAGLTSQAIIARSQDMCSAIGVMRKNENLSVGLTSLIHFIVWRIMEKRIAENNGAPSKILIVTSTRIISCVFQIHPFFQEVDLPENSDKMILLFLMDSCGH